MFNLRMELDLPMVPLDQRSAAQLLGVSSPGIQALALAVLEEGIRDFLHAAGRVRIEVDAWVSTRGGESPFSFDAVCDTLGLAPEAVRTTLMSMRSGQGMSPRRRPRVRPNAQRRTPVSLSSGRRRRRRARA
jgi:hypothetical protein